VGGVEEKRRNQLSLREKGNLVVWVNDAGSGLHSEEVFRHCQGGASRTWGKLRNKHRGGKKKKDGYRRVLNGSERSGGEGIPTLGGKLIPGRAIRGERV